MRESTSGCSRSGNSHNEKPQDAMPEVCLCRAVASWTRCYENTCLSARKELFHAASLMCSSAESTQATPCLMISNALRSAILFASPIRSDGHLAP